MSSYLGNTATFLIEILFGFYILLVLLRFLILLSGGDNFNPITQFIHNLTNPPTTYLRRFVPGYKGMDLSPVVLALSLLVVKAYLLVIFSGVTPIPHILGATTNALAELIGSALDIYIFCIFARVILSWINTQGNLPIVRLLYDLTDPMMLLGRRFLPPISGIDLSPMLVLIGLYVVRLMVVHPLLDYSRTLM